MSTPELKPETPLTTELCRSIGKSGVDWHHSATLVADFARKLESALNAAREALLSLYDGYQDAPELHEGRAIGEFSVKDLRLGLAALAQIDKALSPQQSKTT